jgi:parallel beta-helix repeat protein
MPRKALAPLALAALAAGSLRAALAAAAVDPASQLIGCDQADTQVTVSASSHLDPTCTWTRGVEIVASDVTLDCQGAHIAAPDRRYGVHVVAPSDVALSNVTVRNCHIEGFLNNVHIEREGFRELAEGAEYEHAFSNIVVEDSTILNSRGVGVFVNGYVTDVTLRRLHVEGAGSSGIYLEHGSKDNVVEHSTIVNNGYGENGPSGQIFEIAGASFWFWGTGREGIAIDGSRANRVADNHFFGNSAGGILLYKNCGEFVNERPQRWWHRRYGADGNTIERNRFVGEDNGVWIASRMGENTLPMDCSDPPYIPGYVLDYAEGNVVRENEFEDVVFGVRVEDDGAWVADNEFTSGDPAHQAIVVGTRFRTEALGQPVDGTTLTGNRAAIAGSTNPYRWIHGHSGTTFADDRSHGRVVGFCQGEQPPVGPFVFVVDLAVYDPENPPPVEPREFPPPEVLPPCPSGCAAGAPLERARLGLGKLHTPPGDDTLSFEGRLLLPHPFDPPLDPVAVGVGIVIEDVTGARLLDAQVPGGAYDPVRRVGWKTSRRGASWEYADKSAAPVAGITRVVVQDLSKKEAGRVQVRVSGRRGAYAVDPANLPLTALLILDPPTAETGQCARASFDGAAQTCRSQRKSVVCR